MDLFIAKAIVIIMLVAFAYAVLGDWIFRRLLRLDEWTNHNVMNGRKGETISTRAGRAVKRTRESSPDKGDWKWCLFCTIISKTIFFWERGDHCLNSYERAKALGKLPD
jgi:hypothetical protein